MSLYRFMSFLCFISLITLSPSLVANEDVPVTVQRLSERLINLRVGDIDLSGEEIVNNVTALSTSRGIIVFDTGYYPQTAYRLRKIIEKEFSRADFALIVNTHWHWDHINGNQAFKDVPIIGQENIIPAIENWRSGLEEFIEKRKERVRHWTEALSKAQPGTDEFITANGWSWAHGRFLEEYEQGFEVILPTVTFRERLEFLTGQASVVMIHVPFHSDNDLVVHIPEEKVLVLGDVFFPGYLPQISPDLVHYLPEVIEKLKSLIESGTVETVIPGHKRLLTFAEFRSFVEYLETVLLAVKKEIDKGATLELAKEHLRGDKRFTALKTIEEFQSHNENIEIIWNYLCPSNVKKGN